MVAASSSPSHPLDSYDVLIVGGGQAGLVLASRLTEDASINVLVVEAGADHSDDPLILEPPKAWEAFGKDKYDWGFVTEPQEHYAGRRINHPRGKGLGGSSAINLHSVTFPSKDSLDAWEALGNLGWGWDAMVPYLTKWHTYHEPSAKMRDALGLHHLDPSLHGKSGPIHLTFGEEAPDFDQAWHKTFQNLGYVSDADPLSGKCHGAYTVPNSKDPRTLQRSYAGNGFFNNEVRARPNLHVITEALVEKIILLDQQAVGIHFRDVEGNQRTISSTETVICAGAFQSPQILELSGIGNPSILNEQGIDPVVDLPGVGENLQDHAMLGISFESKIPTADSFRDPKVAQKAFEQYETSKSGRLARCIYTGTSSPCVPLTTGTESDKFASLLDKVCSSEPSFPAQRQQYELLRAIVTDPTKASLEYLGAAFQLPEGLSSGAIGLSEEARSRDYFTIFSSLSHPFSRGTVHIKSSDPRVAPSIDPKYYSHEVDRELLAHHVQWIDTIVKTEPLASMLVPGGLRIPQNLDLTDDEQVRNAMTTGASTYHLAGTCAMMPKELNGVVDSRLRVHGVKGLRVADASIFPLVPRGNLQTSVYAMAEKAADLIKEDLKAAR